MQRKPGQVAEYGSKEFSENQSIYSVLEKSEYNDPQGLQYPCEFYHRTDGYKPAGSCAIWSDECWGYQIYFDYGTTGGKYSSNKEDMILAWVKLNKKGK